jgi:dTDP-4-dehydrorhamnose reductase
VIRISTPFGPNPSKRKQSFAEFVTSSLRQGKEVRAATDLFSTPTYTPYVSRLITALLEDKKKDEVMKDRKEGSEMKGEIYHVGSVERVSRYDFAVIVARTLGLDDSLIRPVSASQLSFIARRPRDTSFDVGKALKLVPIRPLEEDLRELLPFYELRMTRSSKSGYLLVFLLAWPKAQPFLSGAP